MYTNKSTVVDACLTKIPQRFELVILGSQRARLLFLGAQSAINSNNNVSASKIDVALEEIASGVCSRESIIHSFKTPIEVFEDKEDDVEFEIKDLKDGMNYDDFDIDDEDFDN